VLELATRRLLRLALVTPWRQPSTGAPLEPRADDRRPAAGLSRAC
jgi:hypothetical protein